MTSLVDAFFFYLWKAIRNAATAVSRLKLLFCEVDHRFRTKCRSLIINHTEYPLVSLPAVVNPASNISPILIPRVVVQTWVNTLFGRTHARAICDFRLLNPDLGFVLMSDDEALSFLESNWADHPILSIYKSASFSPLKADIFRYCWLLQNGGYYFDISKGCSVPLRSLHGPHDRRLLSYETSHCNVMPDLDTAHCFQHPNRYLIQWGFGFAPQDPILKRVIELICDYYPLFQGRRFEDPKSAILAFTGPGMFTKAVRDVVKAEGKLEGAQAGINFNGHGIPWMPGSEVRYHLSPPYVLARDAVIVS